MSKRFLSLLMALMLCFSMLPSAALAEIADAAAEKAQSGENTADVYTVGEDPVVQSEEDDDDAATVELTAEHADHPVCGEVCTHMDENGDPIHPAVKWTAKSSFDDQFITEGHYYLTNDVELTAAWVLDGNVDICLNGHTIKRDVAHAIGVPKGRILTLYDCDTQGRGKVNAPNSNAGYGVSLNQSTLNLYGGTITGGKAGVYLSQDSGTFNMYGGTISGSGTGVLMEHVTNSAAVFNMIGGTITDNGTGTNDAGGVHVGSGTFNMTGGSITGNRHSNPRINGAGGVYVYTGNFEMSGDAVISDNSITIKDGTKYANPAGAGGVYVRSGTFKMSDNAKVTDNSITNNSSKDVSGGVYVGDATMTVSDNVNITDNTDGNVYLTDGKFITVDGELGETAAIGVSTSAIAEDSVVTVAKGAKEADLDRFSDDSGKYSKKYANGDILFANGEPHVHPICGTADCTESGHGNELFSALNAAKLSKTTGGYYELSQGNWYLTENLNLDATLYIAGDARLCLNGYGITTTADVDAIGLANGSAFSLCDCNGSGESNGIITHGTDADGTKYTGSGVYLLKGSFTMYGGKISGNTLSGDNSKGAGVYVANEASFTMYGGEISGNTVSGNNIKGAGICNHGTATIGGNAVIRENQMTLTDGAKVEHGKDGGGIYTGGTLTVEGNAQIIDNQTAETVVLNTHGGGIYVSSGTTVLRENAVVKGNQVGSYGAGICVYSGAKLVVSDNVQVTDNEEVYSHGTRKTSNVYFYDAQSMPITVNGALDNSARIGVNLNNNLLPDGTNTVTIAAVDTPSAETAVNWIQQGNFVSDDSLYVIDAVKDGTEAVLSSHKHTWKYTASGATITAKCSECSQSGGSVTIKAPVDSSLVYNGKAKEATLDGGFTNGAAMPEIIYTSIDGLIHYNVPMDAGDYKASITVGGATAEVTYTITKGLLTVDDFVFTPPQNLIYDGTDKIATVTPRAGLKGIGEITLQYFKETPYGFGVTMDGTKDAGTYVVEIRVAEGTNYYNNVLPSPLSDIWKFTVKKTTYGDKNTSGSAMYGNSGTVDLSDLIADGGYAECGDINDPDGVLTGTVTVSGTTLNFGFADDASKVGKTATVGVKVTDATNYDDYIFTVTLTVENKLTPQLEGNVTLIPAEITYGEPLSNIEISGTMKDPVSGARVEGTFAWQTPEKVPDAGTYQGTWKFIPGDTAAQRYIETIGSAQVTVKKANQSAELIMNNYTYGKKPETPSLTNRTGDSNAEVTYYYIGADGNGTEKIWDIKNPPELNAGSYKIHASIMGTDNYNAFTTGEVGFEVWKATPIYARPSGLTAKYGQKLSDITLTNAEGNTPGTWNWQEPDTVLESIGTQKYYADFKPDDRNNYLGVIGASVDVTVGKADGSNLRTTDLTQKYTYTSEYDYTPDWTGLPTGQTWSYNSEYTVSSGSSAKLTGHDFAADGSLLTYAISDGKAGDVVTITLKASCNNYEDFTVTLNITLTDRDEQAALRVIGDNTVVYGQTLQLGTDGGSGTGAVSYTVANDTGMASIDPDTGILTPINVGTVKVTAAKASDNDYSQTVSAPFEITITQAAPVGEPKYTVITSSGKTLEDAALTTDGSTLKPDAGKLEWVDDEGNVLPNDTAVERNKTYRWRFTPDDGNYTVLTGEITLYHVSSGGGGGTTRYTVSFDTNGGNKITSERVKKNGTLTEPAAPTKEGFDFAGWYIDKELKEKYDFSAKITKNITLYAAWTEKDDSANQIILTIGEKDALVFGNTKTNDVAPRIVNDITMLPARFVAENLGANVSWDGDKELVTINGKNLKTNEDITILIYIRSDIAYVNGKEIKLDFAAFVENDRTYTPVRFISEELGASVEWVESEQKVVITKTLPSEN